VGFSCPPDHWIDDTSPTRTLVRLSWRRRRRQRMLLDVRDIVVEFCFAPRRGSAAHVGVASFSPFRSRVRPHCHCGRLRTKRYRDHQIPTRLWGLSSPGLCNQSSRIPSGRPLSCCRGMQAPSPMSRIPSARYLERLPKLRLPLHRSTEIDWYEHVGCNGLAMTAPRLKLPLSHNGSRIQTRKARAGLKRDVPYESVCTHPDPYDCFARSVGLYCVLGIRRRTKRLVRCR